MRVKSRERSKVITVISGRSEPHRSHKTTSRSSWISNHGWTLPPSQTPGIPSAGRSHGRNHCRKYTLHVLYVHTYIHSAGYTLATVLHKTKLHRSLTLDSLLTCNTVNWRPGCASLTHHHKSQFGYGFFLASSNREKAGTIRARKRNKEKKQALRR
jgi:hypothetical protein